MLRAAALGLVIIALASCAMAEELSGQIVGVASPPDPLACAQAAREAPPGHEESLGVIEREIVRLGNIERRKQGLQPLEQDACLDAVARRHSERMAETGTMAHQLDGLGPADRVSRAHIRWRVVAENLLTRSLTWTRPPLCEGAAHAEHAVRAWMRSPGHRANLLNPEVTRIGVGVACTVRQGRERCYSTQVFIRPW